MIGRFYIKRLFVITKDYLAGLVVSKGVLINTLLSCCQRSINDGFNKREQTEAGHRLECEGHSWPCSPRSTLLPSLSVRLSPLHGMQNGPDPPKKKINKPLTEK